MRVVNDFSIQVATVNGSGSQSANSVLLKSIFGMGVPVSGKNLFPSNIAGLAHLVHDPRQQRRIRGAQARDRHPDRDESGDGAEDALALPAGGVAIYEEKPQPQAVSRRRGLLSGAVRQDHGGVCPEAKLRKLVKNMVYVGVVAQLLDIDMDVRRSGAAQAVCQEAEGFDLNWARCRRASTTREKLTKQDPFFIER
jgi:2-oxoglutarate ferredoxin oxidoreductase subunit alpha